MNEEVNAKNDRDDCLWWRFTPLLVGFGRRVICFEDPLSESVYSLIGALVTRCRLVVVCAT
jgi:hypothetical protein